MRICALATWLLILSPLSAQIQSRPGQPSFERQVGQLRTADVQLKIDPDKDRDIRQLLDETGTVMVMKKIMKDMEEQLKPAMINALPPGEASQTFVRLFLEKLEGKAEQQLYALAVPVYDAHFSDQDIKILIKFYGTDVGQKTLGEMPKVMSELYQAGSRWGQEIGPKCESEVLSENPELAKALEKAQKSKAK